MGRCWPAALLGCAVLVAALAAAVECSVTYDKKAVLINGQRRILFSGSIHYPRSTPDLLLACHTKILMVFSRFAQYYFEERYDLVSGFPVWLKYVPGISFRTDNEPFKIENEYGPEGKEFGAAGKSYINWAAKMAVGLGTGVPWVMCKEEDAPDPMAHVFRSPSGCAAFLANYNYKSYAKVVFNNEQYNLPPWSISILPDCKNVVFNTATVGVQTSQMQMWADGASSMMWERYDEEVDSLAAAPMLTTTGLLEQLNVTRDSSDYLWYITSVDVNPSENFLQGGKPLSLSVQSAGHALHVFVNGQLQGSAYGTREDRKVSYNGNANLRAGTNKIALLSVACGLPNVGVHYETWNTGVVGPVVLHGLDEGSRDLTWQTWSYQVGLKGEQMNLNSLEGSSSVEWMQGSLLAQNQQPLAWYRAYFETPSGDEPLALDMGSMGKGQIWINGQSIGRYWTAYANGDCKECSYAGSYRAPKCQSGCGQPTQRWYHVPRSWLQPTRNLLVVFEELGGDSSKIALVKRSVSSVCADVSEDHPNIKNWEIENYGETEEYHKPKVHLRNALGWKDVSLLSPRPALAEIPAQM
ncbi:hypothetical protein PR202_gb18679 [Eleusine coracana subsp. coracana]|uniref:Beta-galactosidase n=1 Tax=Eleusine coracana subsp. coracana TaxID=191504 RepID=A0AAV5F688_ELECO|nr:hypothetical protein PR202_gb18679 [Eleusine coracana subsp. coracana]